MATGQAFASLDLDDGPPVILGMVDIAVAFYAMRMPPEFWDLFAFERVQAGELGIEFVDGVKVVSSEWFYLVFS